MRSPRFIGSKRNNEQIKVLNMYDLTFIIFSRQSWQFLVGDLKLWNIHLLHLGQFKAVWKLFNVYNMAIYWRVSCTFPVHPSTTISIKLFLFACCFPMLDMCLVLLGKCLSPYLISSCQSIDREQQANRKCLTEMVVLILSLYYQEYPLIIWGQ